MRKERYGPLASRLAPLIAKNGISGSGAFGATEQWEEKRPKPFLEALLLFLNTFPHLPTKSYSSSTHSPTMASGSAITLRIVQITDVYRLHNFPHVKTLIEEKKKEEGLNSYGLHFRLTFFVTAKVVHVHIILHFRYYQDHLHAYWRLFGSLSSLFY